MKMTSIKDKQLSDRLDIKKLTSSDIGRWVVHYDALGNEQRGKLKSWNAHTIFVVFNCAGEWDRFQEFTGAGCRPDDLIFERHHNTEG
ncbi:MAG TPA: hypothetical protein VGD05_06205 [Pyrinomonadaceae bacterium]|jgi:hypothetical protein